MGNVVGQDHSGDAVYQFDLELDGLRAKILTYGARLQDLELEGFGHLVLGFPEFAAYLDDEHYIGATIGRFANRIRDGSVVINGVKHQLDQNSPGGHHLHGGSQGTATRNWSVQEFSSTHVVLKDRLPDGHMGYPGNLDVWICFRILPEHTLEIEITAQTDKHTLCNFAHHSYFNLGSSNTIDGHKIEAFAARYLDVDDELIPTGNLISVENSAFDFRQGRILDQHARYDHNMCLDRSDKSVQLAARLMSPDRNLALELSTTEPGLQIYTGHHLKTTEACGHDGAIYGPRAGLALEPQNWPDAPNHVSFPSADLTPEGTYKQVSRFSLQRT